MANQAVGFAGLLAGGVLIAAAITGASLTDVASGRTTGPKPLGGDSKGTTSAAAGDASSPGGGASSDQPTGLATFEGVKVAAWIKPALVYARSKGWTGKVNSGWRSFAEQTDIWNSGVRPAAKPGESNHEGEDFPRGAVDVTEAAQLSQILKGTPFEGLLVWAGSKDPVHFSHPHDGSY